MNYLNLIFRICADELYFFTFILFIDSKMTKSYFKTSFLFFQIVILFYQFSMLRAFPFGMLFLIAIPTFYIQFIWKYKFKSSLWICIQFFAIYYSLSFFIETILFFVDFHHMSFPSFYQNIVFRNLTYYSLKDILASCVASISLILWLSRARLKQLRQRNRYDPITYTVLGVIATSVLVLTYMFLYGTQKISIDDLITISVIFIVSILLVMLWIVNKIVLTLQNQSLLEQQLRKRELERNYYDTISDSLLKWVENKR